MDDGKQTLIDLIIGIVVLTILFVLIGLLWKGQRWHFVSGVLIGAVVSVLMAIHMYRTILKAVDLEEKGAISLSRRNSVIRLFIVAVLLGLAVLFVSEFMAFGILMGFFCLKFSAYIQPLTHKFITKKILKKGR